MTPPRILFCFFFAEPLLAPRLPSSVFSETLLPSSTFVCFFLNPSSPRLLHLFVLNLSSPTSTFVCFFLTPRSTVYFRLFFSEPLLPTFAFICFCWTISSPHVYFCLFFLNRSSPHDYFSLFSLNRSSPHDYFCQFLLNPSFSHVYFRLLFLTPPPPRLFSSVFAKSLFPSSTFVSFFWTPHATSNVRQFSLNPFFVHVYFRLFLLTPPSPISNFVCFCWTATTPTPQTDLCFEMWEAPKKGSSRWVN